MDLIERIIERIVPGSAEQAKIEKAVSELTSRIIDAGSHRSVRFIPQFVGSIAKGTHLKSPDIDMFLKFDRDLEKDEIGDIAKSIGREILEAPEERYAEHPYISGRWMGFRIDLVPCYDVPSGRGKISAVDRTPFHTEFVINHLHRNQENEVRLLKQFMKGVGIYGAESKVQGFSGYLCELLVLKFDNFKRLINSVSAWTPPIMLSIGDEVGREFDEVIMFRDPVDSERNVASPVSPEVLARFIEACQAFREEPSERFFFPRERVPFDDAALVEAIENARYTLLLELPPLGVVDDVLWPQFRKTARSVFEALEREGFEPDKITLDAEKNRNIIVIDCRNPELSPTMIHFGPPEDSLEGDNFVAKWRDRGLSDPGIKTGRWQVEIRREIRTPKDLVTKRFNTLSTGKGFRKIETPKVLDNADLLSSFSDYRFVLSEHYDRRKPWRL